VASSDDRMYLGSNPPCPDTLKNDKDKLQEASLILCARLETSDLT
jgi:hypothetical protein